MPKAIFPADLTGFCIFEIQTPDGYINGDNFAGELPSYIGDFRPNLATIQLAVFGRALLAYADNAGHDPATYAGHLTTNNGIAIDCNDLLTEAIFAREIEIMLAGGLG